MKNGSAQQMAHRNKCGRTFKVCDFFRGLKYPLRLHKCCISYCDLEESQYTDKYVNNGADSGASYLHEREVEK